MSTQWSPGSSLHLREDAEAELAQAPMSGAPDRSPLELLHELRVYQIELEMQNESLRQAQVALETSRDRYVDLFEFAPVGYLTLTRDGQIAAINLTGATLLGEERGKLISRRFARFLAPEEQDKWHKHFLNAFNQGDKQSLETSLLRRDGTLLPVGLASLRVATGDGMPTLNVTLTDIAERRQAVRELQDANARLENFAAEQASHLRELAGELTRAEQRERDVLYGQLHDDMQPLLVAARLSLSSLGSHTPRETCLEVAAEACKHISQVIQVARSLSVQLSPPLVRERGLNPALESLCRWVKSNHGLDVDLRCAPEAEPDDVAVRLLCFNAVRELLMNVVKHAGATQVALTLRRSGPDTLCITVADRGKGFTSAAMTNGTGLAGVSRRLGMVGGALQIDSRPGDGTVVTLSAPLRPVTAAGWAIGSRDRRRRNDDAEDTDCG